jgi:FixJ family two-component response regulator
MADKISDPGAPTVFVLDTDSEVREMVSVLAQAMHLRCAGFSSGEEYLRHYDISMSGCLVTEVRIPGIGGLEVQRQLALRKAPLPVIFLSAHATVPVIVRAMRMGAINFLEKPPVEQDLWEALQEGVQEDKRRRRVAAKRTARSEMIDKLEPDERRILELIGRGASMKEVANILQFSVRTAEVRRSKLMQKLDIESNVELLRLAFAVLDGGSAKENAPVVVNGPPRPSWYDNGTASP